MAKVRAEFEFLGIDNIRKELEKLGFSFKEIDKLIKDITKKSLKNYADQDKNAKQLNDTIEKQTQATKELTDEEKKQNKEKEKIVELTKKIEQARKGELSEVEKLQQELKNVNLETIRLNKLQSQQEGSINKLNAELRENRRVYSALSREERENEQIGGRLAKVIQDQDIALKNLKKETRGTQTSLRGLLEVGENLTTIFQGSLQAIGLVAAGFGKVIDAGKRLGEVSNQLAQVQSRLKLTGTEAQNITSNINSLVDVFEVDFNEILKAITINQRVFGIQGQQSIELITQALSKVPAQGNEVLDQFNEYANQLKFVGVTAEESLSIITQTIQQGFFSDKGVDAIKEAGIRLSELTPATQAALKNIGLSGSEIQKQLRDGSKSLFDIIQEVANKINTLPAQGQEVAAALADIFGSPGEDARDFIAVLGNLEQSLGKVRNETSDYQKLQLEFNKIWNDFLVDIAPLVIDVFADFNKFLNENKDEIKTLSINIADLTKNLIQLGSELVNVANKGFDFFDKLIITQKEFKEGNANLFDTLTKALDKANVPLAERETIFNKINSASNELIKTALILENIKIIDEKNIQAGLGSVKDVNIDFENLKKNALAIKDAFLLGKNTIIKTIDDIKNKFSEIKKPDLGIVNILTPEQKKAIEKANQDLLLLQEENEYKRQQLSLRFKSEEAIQNAKSAEEKKILQQKLDLELEQLQESFDKKALEKLKEKNNKETELYIEKQQQQSQALYDAEIEQLNSYDREIELVTEKYAKLYELAVDNNELQKELELAYNEEIKQIQQANLEEKQAQLDQIRQKTIEDNEYLFSSLNFAVDQTFTTMQKLLEGNQDAFKDLGESAKNFFIGLLADFVKAQLQQIIIQSLTAGKSIALAAGTSATLTGIYASPAYLASVATLGGAAAAGTAAITAGLATTKALALAASLPIAEQGAVIGGNPHSKGGTNVLVNGVPTVNAEKDEIILTKGVKKNPVLFAEAERLNILGGGGPLGASPIKMANGGTIPNSPTINTVDSEARTQLSLLRRDIRNTANQQKVLVVNSSGLPLSFTEENQKNVNTLNRTGYNLNELS